MIREDRLDASWTRAQQVDNLPISFGEDMSARMCEAEVTKFTSDRTHWTVEMISGFTFHHVCMPSHLLFPVPAPRLHSFGPEN